MMRIGLTGSIGAGKSTVSAILRELGAPVIDADAISRELTAGDMELLAEIRDAFGAELFYVDGRLNRKAMAERVFSDANERKKLEDILHPRIMARILEQETAYRNEKAVVFDVPLLYETGIDRRMDAVWVVDAPMECRIRRLADRDNMDRMDAKKRIDAQLSDEEKRKRADVLIENNGELLELRRKVESLWKSISERSES